MSTFNHPIQGRLMRKRLTLFLMVVFLSSRMVFQKPSTPIITKTTTSISSPVLQDSLMNKKGTAKATTANKDDSFTFLEGVGILAIAWTILALMCSTGSSDSYYGDDFTDHDYQRMLEQEDEYWRNRAKEKE